MKFTIEEKEKEIEMLEKQLETAETEEDIIIREAREAEERAERIKQNIIKRKEVVFDYFKILTNRDMTEAEYKEYIEIYDNEKTRKGFNLKNFIEGDKGKPIIDDYNQSDVQKQ
jgi:predicted RNase H-like nuclease (RuvC/YqgF family)